MSKVRILLVRAVSVLLCGLFLYNCLGPLVLGDGHRGQGGTSGATQGGGSRLPR